MRKTVTILAFVLLAAPAMGAFFVAGDFNGWNSAGNAMTDLGGGVWSVDLAGIGAGRHEFKVTMGDWSWSHPGANSWLVADGSGNATVKFDSNTVADGWSPNTNRIAVSTDAGLSWNAVGNFLSKVGGSDWTNNDPAGVLAPQGGGIFSRTHTLPPGTYEWKAVMTGTWDSISWDNRSVNTANWTFDTTAVLNQVTFSVDTNTGTARVAVTPEPATLGLLLIGTAFVARRRRA